MIAPGRLSAAAGWDRRHHFVLSLIAELPVGHDRRYWSAVPSLADVTIGGWQFNNTNAGRINSTASSNDDPQRNFQFALKLSF